MNRPHYIPTSVHIQIHLIPGEDGPFLFVEKGEETSMSTLPYTGWTLLAQIEVPLPNDPALFKRAHERLLTSYEAKRNDVRVKALQADQALSALISNLQALPAPAGD